MEACHKKISKYLKSVSVATQLRLWINKWLKIPEGMFCLKIDFGVK